MRSSENWLKPSPSIPTPLPKLPPQRNLLLVGTQPTSLYAQTPSTVYAEMAFAVIRVGVSSGRSRAFDAADRPFSLGSCPSISDESSQKAKQKRLVSAISLFSLLSRPK